MSCCERPPYYMTAYGLWRKQGHDGTEADFLAWLKGERGERGEPGRGLTILGFFESQEALAAAVTEPEVGDAYGVGTQAPYSIFIWDGAWNDTGPIKGDKGDKGDTGRGLTILGFFESPEALAAAVTEPEIGDAYGVGAQEPYSIFIWAGSWVDTGPIKGDKGDPGAPAEVDATLTAEGKAADAKAAGDARAELRARLLQTASAVTPLLLTADAIDDNPGTVLMPDGSTAATASAIGASDAYACKTGQTLAYTLSTQAGRLVLAVYDAAGNLTHGVEGNGYGAYITGEYTFAADDAYFRVGGVTGGNYRKNYALSYSYGLPNAATRADIEAIGDALQEALQVSDALDTSGLSWNDMPPDFYSGDEYENSGITFTKREDNSVHSVGTATDQARYYWLYKYSMTPGTYTIGGIPDGAGMQSFALQYAITEGAPGSGDYKLILADTEITVPQGQLLTIRSWYKTGYVDEGHDWNVFLGKNIGEMDSKANPKNFVPVIYENQKAVQELRGYALPTYWETYLQEKAVDIRNAVYSVGNHGVVFQFFTDFHRPQSDVNYRGYTTLPQLLAYIKKHCFVDDVIFGGDVLQKNATAEEAAAVLEQYAQEFAELKPLNIVGNHDGNRYGGDPAGSAPVGADTLYSILFRGMEGRVRMGPGLYWYRDNDAQKVRLIALNTGTDALSEWNADAAQHRWLADTLAGTPEGYTLIVIPHVFFQMSGGALALSAIGSSVKAVVDAYAARSSGTWQGVSYDFTHAGGTVACILCGHTHNDGVMMSDAGYPMIGTVCEAMWGSQQTAARGTQAKQTTNEHAFDVVCLDTGSKTVQCVRVGSGADRTFTYS